VDHDAVPPTDELASQWEDEPVPKVLLTVKLKPAEASVEGARTKLGLGGDALDPGFGLVPIDPDHDLYAVLVEDTVAEGADPAGLAGGPYANPTIQPLGPPRSSRSSKPSTSSDRKGK
jgi:hypothetical protein